MRLKSNGGERKKLGQRKTEGERGRRTLLSRGFATGGLSCGLL